MKNETELFLGLTFVCINFLLVPFAGNLILGWLLLISLLPVSPFPSEMPTLGWWDHYSDPTQSFQCPYRSAFSPSFIPLYQLLALPESHLILLKPCSFVAGNTYICNKYFLLYLIFKLALKAQFCPVSADHGHGLVTWNCSNKTLADFLWLLCSSNTLG